MYMRMLKDFKGCLLNAVCGNQQVEEDSRNRVTYEG